jgi:hypothetical protein
VGNLQYLILTNQINNFLCDSSNKKMQFVIFGIIQYGAIPYNFKPEYSVQKVNSRQLLIAKTTIIFQNQSRILFQEE